MDKKIFVSRLKEIREKYNLKQRDMYEAMKCSQSAYSTYESLDNNKFPSVENLFNLSQSFNVSIDWLLGIDILKTNKEPHTLSDIIEKLFWIDEYARFDIGCQEEGYYYQEFEDSKGYYIDKYELCFWQYDSTTSILNDFLKEWKDVKEFCKGKDIGLAMFALWKKDVLEKAQKEIIYKPLPFT